MPPRKALTRGSTRRANQRRTIPIAASRGPPKNPHKRSWTSAHDLQLLQSFALAYKNSKSKIWPRIRRDPRFQIFLGPYSRNDLLKKYGDLSKEEEENHGLFFNQQIVPLATPQRRAHIPLETVPLSISTAPLAPLYGPRWGVCDSDDDFDPAQSNEDNYQNSSALLNRPLTELSDSLKERIEDTTIECLKFKLSSTEYQASLMLARHNYNKENPDTSIDQITMPPVNGVTYMNLPPFPAVLMEYSEKLPVSMQLLSPSAFFPTMQDEYRYLYQQIHFYYTHRTLPISFQHTPELYYTIQQRLRAKVKRVGEDGDVYHYQDIHDLYYDQPQIMPDDWNKKIDPKYCTPLASLKTYLNNILGFPMWYSIVVSNYLYLFQEVEYMGNELIIQPQDLLYLHGHQRKILNILITQHFSRFFSVFGTQPAMHNPKERFQALSVGGGRHVHGNDKGTTLRLHDQGQEDEEYAMY